MHLSSNADGVAIERSIAIFIGDLIFKRGRFSWESGYWDDDGPENSFDAGYDLGSD
jgi:hypothetical protein